MPLKPRYLFSSETRLHEVYVRQGIDFIRDDRRLNDLSFLAAHEEDVGEPMPYTLRHMAWCISSKYDALEAAAGIRKFFADDECLLWFASWLEDTSQFCSTYRLSY